MNRLLIGGALAALVVAIGPAIAQPAPPPPPGVAQGTTPAPMVTPAPLQRREQVRVRMMGDRVMTRDEVVSHVREIFSRFDTNNDGYVTKQELDAFRARFEAMGGDIPKRLEDHGVMMGDANAMFDKLDTNHDGSLSRQEFTAGQTQMHRVMIIRNEGGPGMPGMDGEHMKMRMHGMGVGGGFGTHLFEMADTNHDGRVSLQEAEAAALAHFDKADLNHDGKLTPDERRQVHVIMREERHSS